MTSPRLPLITPGMCTIRLSLLCRRLAWHSAERRRLRCHVLRFGSRIEPREHDRRVSAAESERVRQHAAERHTVTTLARDRHVRERWVEVLDVRALANEAVVQHQERIDRLLGAGGAERMAGE